jgi:hypothetical protein
MIPIRQVVVRLHQLVARRLGHALAQEESVAGAEEDHEPIPRLRDLQKVGADLKVAMIPSGGQADTRLVIAKADPQKATIDAIVGLDPLRIIQESQISGDTLVRQQARLRVEEFEDYNEFEDYFEDYMEREAPERYFGRLSKRQNLEDRYAALLKGPLKTAIKAICADLGLKPNWRL